LRPRLQIRVDDETDRFIPGWNRTRERRSTRSAILSGFILRIIGIQIAAVCDARQFIITKRIVAEIVFHLGPRAFRSAISFRLPAAAFLTGTTFGPSPPSSTTTASSSRTPVSLLIRFVLTCFRVGWLEPRVLQQVFGQQLRFIRVCIGKSTARRPRLIAHILRRTFLDRRLDRLRSLLCLRTKNLLPQAHHRFCRGFFHGRRFIHNLMNLGFNLDFLPERFLLLHFRFALGVAFITSLPFAFPSAPISSLASFTATRTTARSIAARPTVAGFAATRFAAAALITAAVFTSPLFIATSATPAAAATSTSATPLTTRFAFVAITALFALTFRLLAPRPALLVAIFVPAARPLASVAFPRLGTRRFAPSGRRSCRLPRRRRFRNRIRFNRRQTKFTV
jgi:hypothetical protein